MQTKKRLKREDDLAIRELTEHDIESFWESALNGDDREFWQAEFASKVPPEEKRPFGSFLADVVAGRLPAGPSVSAERDALITARAAEPVFGPKQVARLKAEVAELKAQVVALKRVISPNRKCPLWHYVREIKRKNPSKSSDQAFIARCVDVLLGKTQKELRKICPKSWKEVRELPRLLSDARKHPVLKNRIKGFISKVVVS
jgi:hypothetical protein